MLTIRPRRAAALLVVLSLICAAFPASAAPEPTRNGLVLEPRLIQRVMDWLGWLWPGTDGGRALQSDSKPQRIVGALGSDADPDGTPQVQANVPPARAEPGPDGDPGG